MLNYNVNFNKLYSKAQVEYKGSTDMSEGDFKDAIEFVLEDMTDLYADDISDKLVETTQFDSYCRVTIPNDFQRLIKIDGENGTPLFPCGSIRELQRESNLYMADKSYIYFNSRHKKIRLNYIANIEDVTELMFPNDSSILGAFIYGALWSYRNKQFGMFQVGTQNQVNWALGHYNLYKNADATKRTMLEIKRVYNEHI